MVPLGPENATIKEFFLRNLHYDGFWTNSSNGPRIYGTFGAHFTLARQGRVYLWGPPGVILLRGSDGRVLVRWTWGVDIYVADVPIPFWGSKRPLYLTIGKAFRPGESLDIVNNPNSGIDMIGFSVTMKREK